MSLRTFLGDIIYEASDRIAVSALYAKYLTTQVTQNCHRPQGALETASNVDRDSQMDVDEQDADDAQEVTFFGDTPRALQPLLKQNRRRHEFHASKSSPSSSILQVKAIRQKMNGACGYYSLFHSSMYAVILCLKGKESTFSLNVADDVHLNDFNWPTPQSIIAREVRYEDDALIVLRQMFNKAMFFVMMAKWKAQLLAHAADEKNLRKSVASLANWKPLLIKSGVMERAYMDYLLDHDSFIQGIKLWTGASFHALPEISLSQLKNRLSIATLETVSRISNDLAQDNKPHAFLIGQLNHWIAIVSNRVELALPPSTLSEATKGVSSSESKMKVDQQSEIAAEHPHALSLDSFSTSASGRHTETILLDSRNDFVLNMGPKDIQHRVNKRVRREFNPTGSMWHELCVRLYEQSLADTQYSCDMFHALTNMYGGEMCSENDSASSSSSASTSAKNQKSSGRTSSSSSKSADGRKEKRKSAGKKKTEHHPITTELILLYVNGFFEGFAEHVGDRIEVENEDVEKVSTRASDIADWIFKFQIWVQEYSPLRAIEDNFIQSLRNAKKHSYIIPDSVPRALSRWVDLLQNRIAQAQSAKVTNEDVDEIIADLFENTVPFILSSIKYLRR